MVMSAFNGVGNGQRGIGKVVGAKRERCRCNSQIKATAAVGAGGNSGCWCLTAGMNNGIQRWRQWTMVRRLQGEVGGSVAKVPFFQMVQISLLSVLIYSTRCEYDILKVLFLKNDRNLSVACVKYRNVSR
jgi:hypothetical protein